MRRPSPLPPPVRGEAKPSAPVHSAEPVSSAADVLDEDLGTAPVIPLTGPSSPSGAEASPVATRPDAAPRPAPDAESIGWSEVWRAARARRKALRAEVRRFTTRQRRRRAVWIGSVAAVVVLALGTLGAAYSPLFAVETITVVGAEQLDDAQVVAALDAQLGTPIPLVDESAVKAALIAFPLVESYTLEARPPHELVVRIVERTPIGVIETRAGATVVDAAGVALSTAAEAPAGLPVLEIDGGVGSDAFLAAGQVMHSLPDDIRAQVTRVAASTPDDVTLTLGATRTAVVWGSAERSADKAAVLAKIMTARPPASVRQYDVSSPNAVVVR
ncbi:FtsQ-type POTRA domain-containing protein [Microbacterium sp. SSM24]|uniref:FtsQ-type POTRA domain-containing protein n=1 Tax=Microbacterium sp. SSM24 TaxID=2991714 RepID=UPI002227CE25|nr:FtsQ-type POTRA domain-containing protein [Microbacterium sp. SSM24]MCW3494747.1 FtsQ-type POTRA domain-containing protein [Microbacterium sp. SSM24]